MTDVLGDLRFAARTLIRSPWFTSLAVLTLAVGIGATTAVFSLVDAVLVRPMPFKEPHRLVEIWGRDHERTGMRVPGAILDALRLRAKTLQAIGTHDPSGGVLRGTEGGIDIRGEAVSANFVDVFGVPPLVGRGFAPEDERPGAPAVMLVSFSFWQQHLGADPDGVGRTVYLDAVPYTVVGIMPRDFRTIFRSGGPVFWTPYAASRSRERERELGYEVVARLASGVTLDDARREIDAIASGVGIEGWVPTGRRRIGLVPLREEVVGNRAQALHLLFAGVAVVLAVACANLAQLLLARSDRRIIQFATRKALGAATGQLFRLALLESLMLSLAGGAAGVVLAYWLLPLMLALAPDEIPRLADASIDERVLLAAIGISVSTGCVFGVAPALRLSRLSLIQAMRPAGGLDSPRGTRLRGVLVVVQVAAAVTLVALAGLIVQTFLTLLPASPGFATTSRTAFVWSLDERQFTDAADRRQRVESWMQHVEAVPGIAAVGMASGIPFGDDEPRNVAVRLPDDARPAQEVALRSDLRAVSLNLFDILQIPLVQGRNFTRADRAEAPRVALVNQTLARRLDASGNVIGQSIRIGNALASPLAEIVGIVADTRWWGMTLDPLNEVYIPLAQDRASFGFLFVRSERSDSEVTAAVRRSFYAAMPGAALSADRRAVPLDELIGRSIAGPRFSAALVASFSVIALILSGIGLFGLVAYSVARRRRELGVRTALGARPRDLIVTTVRTAVVLTAVGIVTGLGAAAYLTRFIESELYAIEPLDLPTFAGAAIIMLLAAACAAYIPARTAAHADPMQSLRYE